VADDPEVLKEPLFAGAGLMQGKAFIAAIRLYRSGTEFYDQAWKPDDLVKVN
jgi:hypothetical protein